MLRRALLSTVAAALVLAAGTAQFGIIRSTRIGGREIQLAMKFLF